MIAFFKAIRPFNLIIVALTQVAIYNIVIAGISTESSIEMALNSYQLFGIILITICITAGGYFINDFYDYGVDKINKPSLDGLKKSSLLRSYILVLVLGGAIAYLLALDLDRIGDYWIYGVVVFLLWAYSYKLQHLPLIGNIIVSLLCFFVPGILLVAELKIWNHTKAHILDHPLALLFAVYCVFAFMANLQREITKDIEDMEGDATIASATLPLIAGMLNASRIAGLIGVINLVIQAWFLFHSAYLNEAAAFIMGIILFLMVPQFYITILLFNIKEKEDAVFISKLLKLYMIIGLFFLLSFSTLL